ncbi:hypothetical protein [Methylocystis hirsuta]|nr:hypothetical protein [Methylocystis hirsuta]
MDRLSVERQLDAFLLKAKSGELTRNARELKHEIEKKQAAAGVRDR